MKKILLLNTSFPIQERAYSSFGPPLGIISIASALRQNGYDVIFIDPQIEKNYEELIATTLSSDVLFVGMSAYMGENLKNCKRLTKNIKSTFPNIPVVWGGPFASSIPEACFNESEVDHIVMGAGELTVLQLAECLSEGTIDGIYKNQYISSRMEDGSLKLGNLYSFSGSADDLPLIDLSLWEKGVQKMNAIPLITSRGCPYKCTFCYNTFNENGNFFLRSYESVIKEMDYTASLFSCKHFLFMDDNFLINEERAMKILSYAKSKGYRIGRVYGHLNNFTPKIQEEIINQQIGVTMCVESGSPRIRKILNKHINTDKALLLIENLTKASVSFVTAFLFGIPNESSEDIQQSIELAKKIDSVSDGKAVSMFYLYAPQPKDGLVAAYSQKNSISFTIENMSDIEVVPVPPNDVINLSIRPWMTEDMSRFYLNLAQVWLYHFNKKANRSFCPEAIYSEYPLIKEMFS